MDEAEDNAAADCRYWRGCFGTGVPRGRCISTRIALTSGCSRLTDRLAGMRIPPICRKTTEARFLSIFQ